jgi:hypothetical protein
MSVLCYYTIRILRVGLNDDPDDVEFCDKPAPFGIVRPGNSSIDCDGRPYMPVCAEHYDLLKSQGWRDANYDDPA